MLLIALLVKTSSMWQSANNCTFTATATASIGFQSTSHSQRSSYSLVPSDLALHNLQSLVLKGEQQHCDCPNRGQQKQPNRPSGTGFEANQPKPEMDSNRAQYCSVFFLWDAFTLVLKDTSLGVKRCRLLYPDAPVKYARIGFDYWYWQSDNLITAQFGTASVLFETGANTIPLLLGTDRAASNVLT